MATLKANGKAYFDSFGGLVPCKVLSVARGLGAMVKLKVTADRGAYKRGEVFESSSLWVFPRAAVHVVCGQYRVRPYNVEAD